MLKAHKDKTAVEVVLPVKPRLTLCLSKKMSLGDAVEKIVERFKEAKRGDAD